MVVEKSGVGLKCVKREMRKYMYIYSGVVAPAPTPLTPRKSALRKGFEARAHFFGMCPKFPKVRYIKGFSQGADTFS